MTLSDPDSSASDGGGRRPRARPAALVAAAVLAAGVAAGCGGDEEQPAGPTATQPPAGGEQTASGRELFTSVATPSCSNCHALADAEATGTIGPDLDDLQPDAQRVIAAMRNGPEIMPSYTGRLSERQMEQLAEYVATAAGGG